MTPPAKTESGLGRMIVVAVAMVVAFVLISPMVASATTTSTELPFETLYRIGGERAGTRERGEFGAEAESCVGLWVIRFHVVPGAESYSVRWFQNEQFFTRTGPASTFPGTFDGPPDYAVFDAPPGYLELLAGGQEIHSEAEEPESPTLMVAKKIRLKSKRNRAPCR